MHSHGSSSSKAAADPALLSHCCRAAIPAAGATGAFTTDVQLQPPQAFSPSPSKGEQRAGLASATTPFPAAETLGEAPETEPVIAAPAAEPLEAAPAADKVVAATVKQPGWAAPSAEPAPEPLLPAPAAEPLIMAPAEESRAQFKAAPVAVGEPAQEPAATLPSPATALATKRSHAAAVVAALAPSILQGVQQRSAALAGEEAKWAAPVPEGQAHAVPAPEAPAPALELKAAAVVAPALVSGVEERLSGWKAQQPAPAAEPLPAIGTGPPTAAAPAPLQMSPQPEGVPPAPASTSLPAASPATETAALAAVQPALAQPAGAPDPAGGPVPAVAGGPVDGGDDGGTDAAYIAAAAAGGAVFIALGEPVAAPVAARVATVLSTAACLMACPAATPDQRTKLSSCLLAVAGFTWYLVASRRKRRSSAAAAGRAGGPAADGDSVGKEISSDEDGFKQEAPREVQLPERAPHLASTFFSQLPPPVALGSRHVAAMPVRGPAVPPDWPCCCDGEGATQPPASHSFTSFLILPSPEPPSRLGAEPGRPAAPGAGLCARRLLATQGASLAQQCSRRTRRGGQAAAAAQPLGRRHGILLARAAAIPLPTIPPGVSAAWRGCRAQATPALPPQPAPRSFRVTRACPLWLCAGRPAGQAATFCPAPTSCSCSTWTPAAPATEPQTRWAGWVGAWQAGLSRQK